MGCGCGKGTKRPAPPKKPPSATQSFALRMDDGRVMTFGSRLEAEAAKVRAGYSGTVVQGVGS